MRYLIVGLIVGAVITWTLTVNLGHADQLHDQLIEAGAPLTEDGFAIVSEPYPFWLIETCRAKGDVTMFTYQHRDKITEEDSLTILKRDWNDTWADLGLEWATYVDMQRIVRDAYRTDNKGEYRRQEALDVYVADEINACLDVLQY